MYLTSLLISFLGLSLLWASNSPQLDLFKFIIQGKIKVDYLYNSLFIDPKAHFSLKEYTQSFSAQVRQRLAAESGKRNLNSKAICEFLELVSLWIFASETRANLQINDFGWTNIIQNFPAPLKDHFEPDEFDCPRPEFLMLVRPPERFLELDSFLLKPRLLYGANRKDIKSVLTIHRILGSSNLFFAAHYFSLTKYIVFPNFPVPPIKICLDQLVKLEDSKAALKQRLILLNSQWDNFWTLRKGFVKNLYSLFCYLTFLKYSVISYDDDDYPLELHSEVEKIYIKFFDTLDKFRDIVHLTTLYAGKPCFPAADHSIYLANIHMHILPQVLHPDSHFLLLKKSSEVISIYDLHIYLIQRNYDVEDLKAKIEKWIIKFFKIDSEIGNINDSAVFLTNLPENIIFDRT